jgi:hypothetical protein
MNSLLPIPVFKGQLNDLIPDYWVSTYGGDQQNLYMTRNMSSNFIQMATEETFYFIIGSMCVNRAYFQALLKCNCCAGSTICDHCSSATRLQSGGGALTDEELVAALETIDCKAVIQRIVFGRLTLKDYIDKLSCVRWSNPDVALISRQRLTPYLEPDFKQRYTFGVFVSRLEQLYGENPVVEYVVEQEGDNEKSPLPYA